MAVLWSQHFPAAEQPPSFPSASPPPPPPVLYTRCVVCPTCNVICPLLTVAKSVPNLNRQYFVCPNRNKTHKFFKWVEELRLDELVDVPDCGGCSAGLCRVRRERSGPNAGRILFMCRIKEGEGSCGYRVWKDELEKSIPGRGEERINLPKSSMINGVYTTPENNELVTENEQSNERSRSRSRSNDELLVTESSMGPQRTSAERVTSFQQPSPMVNCNLTESEDKNTDFFEENNQSNEGANSESSRRAQRLSDVTMTLFPPLMVNSDQIEPVNIDLVEEYNDCNEGEDSELPLIYTSNPKCIGVTSTKMDLLNGQKNFLNELSSRRHHKRSRNGDLMDDEFTLGACDVSYLLDPSFIAQDDKTLAKSKDLTTLTKILLGVETYNKPLLNPCHNPQLSRIKPKYHPTETNIQNVMSQSISNAFSQAAEHLQNKFFALLDETDIADHEAMSQAAQVTFSALDQLRFDRHDFKERAEEYIHCATSLAEIERSMPGDDSHRKLVEQCWSERLKLDEINSAHAKVADSVNKIKNRLKLVQEEISSTMDWLFQIEAEMSCCEVEMKCMEGQLEKIRKEKELIQRKEAEWVAAKAAFERAKELLRG